VKAPEVIETLDGLERSKTGQLLVTPTLRTTKDPAIYAIGDCASPRDAATHRPVPRAVQRSILSRICNTF
jgi:NADH dehydrogenase